MRFPEKLTIGMAVYEDYDGVFFTTQALRYYHQDVNRERIKFLVVDNSPESIHSPHIKEFVEDTVGEDVRVTDTAAVLVTLDDEDTDGERVFDMDIEGEGLSEGSKDDVNPGEELPDPLSKAVLEGVA